METKTYDQRPSLYDVATIIPKNVADMVYDEHTKTWIVGY